MRIQLSGSGAWNITTKLHIVQIGGIYLRVTRQGYLASPAINLPNLRQNICHIAVFHLNPSPKRQAIGHDGHSKRAIRESLNML